LQLTSQTKWFFEHCPAKIIGITGTKGKGTTSTLIYEMLHAARFMLHAKSYLTGNIGKVQPLEILDNLSADDLVVYELSSFQLLDLNQSPHIGVVLMVTGEHLDYHKNVREYREAKTSIVKYQTKDDVAVINHDFPASMAIGAFGKGKKLFFSRVKTVEPGSFIKAGYIEAPMFDFKFPAKELQLRGRHNYENVCAAVLAAGSALCPPKIMKDVLKKFRGLEHRLEFIAEKKGVKFFNDSFSTTPETCIAALESFSEPLVAILGGSSKNSDFKALGQTLAKAQNLKAIVLIGQEASRIKNCLNKAGGSNLKILEGAVDMTEIFEQIKSVAKKGDVVLLSPACASFDMFSSYVDRGNQFKLAVKSF
jgi:UDP-N-acetylmuramoylalanine--D-glutamate ligase